MDNQKEKIFDIPGFTYFESKNPFSGSIMKRFNYKIWYGEKFSVKVWYGENCFSCTPEEEIKASAEFEFTPKGLEEIHSWLFKQLEIFKQSN